MPHPLRRALLVVLLGSAAGWAAAPAAVAPEIQDGGKFFSPAAVKKANERLAAIYRKYDRDILIETFASVPEGDADKLKAADKAERAEYFLSWAKDRVAQRAVNGVYVLICKEPRYLRVGVVEKQPHLFPGGFRDAVEEALMKEFRESHFDEGLEKTIQLVEEKLAKQVK
jgi:uncharacterized membrane protein YgcG